MTGLWDYSIMCLKLDVLYIGLCRDHEKPKFLWQKGELFWVSVTTWSFFLIALVAGELIMPPCLGPYADMYIIKLVDIIKSLRTLLFWWVLKFHLKCCFRSRCFLYLKYYLCKYKYIATYKRILALALIYIYIYILCEDFSTQFLLPIR